MRSPKRLRRLVDCMLYRQAGIFHTDYAADRALFPIPFERRAMILLLLFALVGALDAQLAGAHAATCCRG